MFEVHVSFCLFGVNECFEIELQVGAGWSVSVNVKQSGVFVISSSVLHS